MLKSLQTIRADWPQGGVVSITDMFAGLDPDKKRRILNAALTEFAEAGYARASTNRIVKAAGIGKGMLFYYFGSKHGLFCDLIRHTLDYLTTEYLPRFNTTEPDFIKRLYLASLLKIEAMSSEPEIFNFLGMLYFCQDDESVPIPPEMRRRLRGEFSGMLEKVTQNIDSSRFRDEIPPGMAVRMIRWTFDGYQRELSEHMKSTPIQEIDRDAAWAEYYAFLKTLKIVFYKDAT